MYNLTMKTKKVLAEVSYQAKVRGAHPAIIHAVIGKSTKTYMVINGEMFCVLSSPKILSFNEKIARVHAIRFYLECVLN